MAEFVSAAYVADIAPGKGKTAVVNGKDIALYNVDGTFYAIDGICIHRGGPLGEGELQGKIVTCPWHQWTYDVTTGTSTLNPAAKVGCYETKIESGEVMVFI
jgi:nitrite reductase (NADH) small subunit